MSDRQAFDEILHTLETEQRLSDSDTPPMIAIVGAFSRGKSALVNALIGTLVPLLPVHPLPTTAVPTRIEYAKVPHARLIYSNHEQIIAVDEVRTIAAYRGVTNRLREIRIGWPCAMLESGLVLLDTPGIEAVTSYPPILPYERELGGAGLAALLFVFTADPPLGEAELGFLHQVALSVPHLILVQTKCDALPEPALQQATAFNRAAIDATCPQLTNIPIYSVSALTGAGIALLRDTLAGWNTDTLRRDRDVWRMAAARARMQTKQDMLDAERSRSGQRDAALKVIQARYAADLEAIRAEALATLARLSEYTVGSLSAVIYHMDPAELSGAHGLALANTTLRQIRDQLVNEIERALIESRRRLIDSITAEGLPTGTIPELRTIVLPDPYIQTVAVRIAERRMFHPKHVDAVQTINAYRTAVAHMTDAYAAQLLPLLESLFDARKI